MKTYHGSLKPRPVPLDHLKKAPDSLLNAPLELIIMWQYPRNADNL